MDRPDVPEAARADLDSWREAAGCNRFDGDGFFHRLLRRGLGDDYATWEPRLQRLAEETGSAIDELVTESNRDENLPVLCRRDADGRATESVTFHPAYHEVGRAFWSSGVLSVLADPGSERISGAIAYLLDQHGEAGHACPVACTAGAIKLIRKVGTDDQRSRYLPGLLDEDYDRRLHAAQFVTEVQGGSDVGRNACLAEPEPDHPGHYRLRGEKWFCSVADAGLFVVSARIAGAADGTGGLGLFLVPRTIDGSPNGFALERLKTKLGTRSMATGEITFDGALAELIGPPESGFRNLVEIVLDTSRVHNALASCGLMRRAFVEALEFSRHRRAFGKPIIEFPAVRETLARMKLRSMAGLATTFRILEMTDRLERDGGAELAAARRIAVMINKYRTSLAATQTVRDGIEILGGNGTIEEFSCLPRLYRDAIVFESWEGTHNTLCAQVLRDFARYGMHRPWLEMLGTEAGGCESLHERVAERIDRLLAADPPDAAGQVRHVVDLMCRLTERATLLAQASWEERRNESAETMNAVRLHELPDADDSPDRLERIREFVGG